MKDTQLASWWLLNGLHWSTANGKHIFIQQNSSHCKLIGNRIFHLVPLIQTFLAEIRIKWIWTSSFRFFCGLRRNYNATWRCDARNQMMKSMANRLGTRTASLCALSHVRAFHLHIPRPHNTSKPNEYIEMGRPMKTISIAFVLRGGAIRLMYWNEASFHLFFDTDGSFLLFFCLCCQQIILNWIHFYWVTRIGCIIAFFIPYVFWLYRKTVTRLGFKKK